jgi:cobalt transporter subunit CbtB
MSEHLQIRHAEIPASIRTTARVDAVGFTTSTSIGDVAAIDAGHRQVDLIRLAGSITTVAPALATIALGMVVLFCVGFLQAPAAHNATHDTRHANGFPCH